MNQRYTVVRFPSRSPLESAPAHPGLESAPVDVRQVRIDDAELGRHEAARLAREPGVALLPVMPIKLVRPVPTPEAAPEPGDGAATGAAHGWGLQEVGAQASRFDGEGVTVAVLDTGIDKAHPAFAGVAIKAHNFNPGAAESDVTDVDGHGTHCAGVLFGRDVGGVRIGVARGVTQALVGKVLDDRGHGTLTAIFKGLQWAITEGAHVISMSIGFDFPGMVQRLVDRHVPDDIATSQALVEFAGALRLFDRIMALTLPNPLNPAGCIVVGAAGNESRRQFDPTHEVAASLPSSAEGAISVGALERAAGGRLTVPGFSNTLPLLCAPGVRIKSAAPGGGLTSKSGTSMAAPHVAGVAALWWQARLEASDSANRVSVLASLLDQARTDVFAPGVDELDRGLGLVTAP